MGCITIRQLDDDVKERLRQKAKRNQRSLEAEARLALRAWAFGDTAGTSSASLQTVGFQISEDVWKT